MSAMVISGTECYCYDAATCQTSVAVYMLGTRVRVSVKVIFSITWPRLDTVTYV